MMMGMLCKKEIDLIEQVIALGVTRIHVKPALYCRIARYVSNEIDLRRDAPNDPAIRGAFYASDDIIIKERLGDKLTWRGVSFRLGKVYR